MTSSLADQHSPSVLVVDDDDQMRTVIRRMLRGTRWRVVDVASAHEALARGLEGLEPFDLILTDVVMPDLDGYSLVARMRAQRPGLRAVYMSGYDHDIASKHGAPPDESLFLKKPFTVAELRGCLRDALGADDRLSS